MFDDPEDMCLAGHPGRIRNNLAKEILSQEQDADCEVARLPS
jgi:hypothetical protein